MGCGASSGAKPNGGYMARRGTLTGPTHGLGGVSSTSFGDVPSQVGHWRRPEVPDSVDEALETESMRKRRQPSFTQEDKNAAARASSLVPEESSNPYGIESAKWHPPSKQDAERLSRRSVRRSGSVGRRGSSSHELNQAALTATWLVHEQGGAAAAAHAVATEAATQVAAMRASPTAA